MQFSAPLKSKIAELAHSGSFQIEGLELKLGAQDRALIDWVSSYLYPCLSPTNGEALSSFEVNCLYSDELVTEISGHICNSPAPVRFREGTHKGLMTSVEIEGSSAQICGFSESGTVYVIEEAARRATLIYSSRSKWPSLEFARLTRYVMSQHLLASGWLLLHAGAMDTEAGQFLIIGESGAGKTTLILALMSAAGKFLANELLYVKPCDQGLRALPFPLPIAIGLGSALQFPHLEKLLHEPYQLLYPPRRLDLEKLKRTYPEYWTEFPDKIQLLPRELAAQFPKSSLSEGFAINGVIVPAVSRTPIEPKAHELTFEDTTDIVLDNLGGRSFGAPWMKLGMTPQNDAKLEDRLMNKISELRCIEFEYHVGRECSNYESFHGSLRGK